MNLKEQWKRPWVRRATLALGLLAAIGVGSAASGPIYQEDIDALETELAGEREKTSDLQATLDETAASLEETQAQAADAEDRLSAAEARIERAEETAANAMQEALQQVRQEQAERSRALDSREQQLNQREREIERRERAVGLRERFIENNSFGDGRYKVGLDIKAGLYHAPGGGNCYWAELRSSDSGDIISNHVGPGPQTIMIDSPWFETQGCGTWKPT